MSRSQCQLSVLLLASDFLLALDRSRDKTEKLAVESRREVRMGPKITGYWSR